ncbi:MAG: DUF1345 domain-containing protein [Leucobacter sp.]
MSEAERSPAPGDEHERGSAAGTAAEPPAPPPAPPPTPPKPSARSRWGTALTLIVETVGLLTQLLLVAAGIDYLLTEDGEFSEAMRLLGWCALGTLYLMATVVWLNIDLRVRRQDDALQRRLLSLPAIRWFSTLVTFSSSLVGLSAAFTLIVIRDDPEHLVFSEFAAVWAMLVSWAMFHWGYARIYQSRYDRAVGDRPLIFPGSAAPRITDFVYFAFTIGTSFANSDVTITDSRMRWSVVWHTTFSFFFNALIIVLTMNTIVGGLGGQ